MAKPYELTWRRLPLEGAHNVRDLGGYPTANGGQTQWHRFLRADYLMELTDADREFLYGYGVRAVLDLRDPSEAAAEPDVQIAPGMPHANFPLLSLNMSDSEQVEREFSSKPPSFQTFYDLIIASRANIAGCLEFIAGAPEGCVLFHCAAGKDRTGVLAMLLMGLAGCDKWDCVSDYIQTSPNLMRHDWYVASRGKTLSADGEDLVGSPAHAIEHVWDVVAAEGGVVAFLRGCGVSSNTLAAVRARLDG